MTQSTAITTTEQAQQMQAIIRNMLEALFNGTQDEQQRSLINATFERSQQLTVLATTTADQRDQALQELADIIQALENQDTDHPRIGGIIETISEDAFYNGVEYGEDNGFETGYEQGMEKASFAVSDNFAETMRENLDNYIPATLKNRATRFITWLLNPEENELTPAQANAMIAMIQTFADEDTESADEEQADE